MTILKLLILFLFGQSGMILAYLMGRAWSSVIQEFLRPILPESIANVCNNAAKTIHHSPSSTKLVSTEQGTTFVLEFSLPPIDRRTPRNVSWIDSESNGRPGTEETETTTCNATSIGSQSPRKAFHEMLVHPLLLNIEKAPEAVALSMWGSYDTNDDDESSLQTEMISLLHEVSKHESVTSVYIVVVGVDGDDDDIYSTSHCHASLATIHQEEDKPTIQCSSFSKLEERNITVDAVILPSWPQSLGDDQDTDFDDKQNQMKFWYDHLSPHGALVAILGKTFPLEYIMDEHDIINDRWDTIAQFTSSFPRIIDYDVPASYYYDYSSSQRHGSSRPHHQRQKSSRFPINVGVAFKSSDGVALWRRNEGLYQWAMWDQFTEDGIDDLVAFGSADMLPIQHPPSHSSWYYCQSYRDDSDCDFHGYDPKFPNIPLTDLYVSKSKIGENAGRGVFAKVDIPFNSNIGLETTTQSIHYEWMTTALHRNMTESVEVYKYGKGRIINVYAEAYGYASSPFEKQQETVMSHFLTFVNHGCNGTANLGERGVDPSKLTEWNINLELGIPDEMKTKLTLPYNPSADRDLIRYATNCVAGKTIRKDEELLDNYMNFGGDEHFEEVVLSLREECSGGLGLVEQYQSEASPRRKKKKET